MHGMDLRFRDKIGDAIGALSVLLVAVVVATGAVAQAPSTTPSAPATPSATSPSLDDLVSAIVHIKTFINPDARTGETLGREREGTGIVIDNNGLVLTIGYLMLEAHAAEVQTSDGRTVPADIVGYDHETGFGLLRALTPMKARPLALGKAADVKPGDRVIVARHGGREGLAPAFVASTPRVSRLLGISARPRDLHRAAGGELERRRTDHPRRQAGRHRLAGRRRRRRGGRPDARQHVRADRSVAADPRPT